MDSFYSNVLIVAFIILIITLIGLGIMLQEQNISIEFPPLQNKCPDHWKVSGDNCVVEETNINLGDIGYEGIVENEYIDSVVETANAGGTLEKSVTWSNESLRCDKKKWSINNGIVWDGVSNYNQC